MKICDLHTHSNASDGSMTPTELVAAAKEAGLSAVALTDHNTTRGLAEFKHATYEAGIEGIFGCEFSAQYKGIELHLLGLFLQEKKWPEIENFLETAYAQKRQSLKECIERLQKDGYSISFEQLLHAFPDVIVPNRVHIALILIEAGELESVKSALDGLLKDGGDYYISAPYPSFLDIVDQIKAWGAAAVWSHPLGFPGTTEDVVEELLPLAKEHGLVGAEAMYSRYTPEKEATMLRLCKRFGVVASGSTDFHGANKPGLSIGTGFGNMCIPYSVVEELKTAISQYLKS